MGKVNVYLPDNLERAVREAGVPVSAVCQSALQAAVDTFAAIRNGDVDASSAPPLTPRLAQILRTGPATALDLLGAIVLHGENLGARVLADLGVELPAPRRVRPKARSRDGGTLPSEVRDVLAGAYRVALELQHDHLGSEHVLVALAQPAAPTAELLAGLGVDEAAVRARALRLLANPWRTDAAPVTDQGPAPEVFDRFEAELRRLSGELEQMRASATRRARRAPRPDPASFAPDVGAARRERRG